MFRCSETWIPGGIRLGYLGYFWDTSEQNFIEKVVPLERNWDTFGIPLTLPTLFWNLPGASQSVMGPVPAASVLESHGASRACCQMLLEAIGRCQKLSEAARCTPKVSQVYHSFAEEERPFQWNSIQKYPKGILGIPKVSHQVLQFRCSKKSKSILFQLNFKN